METRIPRKMRQSAYDRQIRTHFPDAINIHELNVKYLGDMYQNHQIDVSRLVIASCLCSDEVNMPNAGFNSSLAGPFFMGGLGGLPFAGLTGVGAFAHHIPDNGASILFYGPHIGITEDGVLGKMGRPRQGHLSSSCGALMGALAKFQADPNYLPKEDPDDYQQNELERLLSARKEDFLRAENPEKAITEVTFEIIDERIHHLLHKGKAQFGKEKIVLIGGIMVNTGAGLTDYFDVRNYEVLSAEDL